MLGGPARWGGVSRSPRGKGFRDEWSHAAGRALGTRAENWPLASSHPGQW